MGDGAEVIAVDFGKRKVRNRKVARGKKRKTRKLTMRGEARTLLTECLDRIPKPIGVVVIVVGAKGKMKLRYIGEPEIQPIDLLARAETLAAAEKMELLHPGFIDDEESTAE